MSLDRAVRRAAAAAAKVATQAAGRGRTDAEVAALVERFGQHADGYLHARIVVDGQRYYFHRKYGSWLAPGQVGSRTVFKEPEGLLGSQLGSEIKYKLSELSTPYDEAARRERLAREERERGKQQRPTPTKDSRGHDEDVRDAGLRAGADRQHAPDEVPPDGE